MTFKVPSACLAALLALAAGCATGYHSTGLTGGFAETRLSERVFQVRFQGNAYTSQDRNSVFILRRCAELTLENGFRYLSLGAQGTGSLTSGSSGFIFSFPHGTATVKFLAEPSEDPTPLDALFIIKDTDARAGGRLSDFARAAANQFQSGTVVSGAPARGTVLKGPNGTSFGRVLFTVSALPVAGAEPGPVVAVEHVNGGRLWVPLSKAVQMAQ